MRLVTITIPALPRLAWLAVVDPDGGTVVALHGKDVEVGDHFLVEGVWDGPFRAAGFPESDAFFGSGLRVDEDGVVFAPSRALIDRLFIANLASRFVVSNSLPLMLHGLGARLLPGQMYTRETFTILEGLRRYEPRVPLLLDGFSGVEQRYHFPFRISRQGMEVLDADAPPAFETFTQYRQFLLTSLEAVVANASAPERVHPLDFRVTLSRGYDSPAAAALTTPFIAPIAYTASRSNSALPGWLSGPATHDDGSEIAAAMGLPVRRLSSRDLSFDERFFYAGGTGDPELIFASMAEDVANDPRPAVFISGYHGDKVWDVNPGRAYLTDELKRGDTSGLALTEVRLVAGWINVPVPFIGARAIESIVRISQSEEMAPWRVGGSYDRPIPRRIIEEAGVPRGAFGERKRAVVQTLVVPRDRTPRADFGEWLEKSEGRSLRVHRARAALSLTRWAFLRAAQKAGSLLGLSVREPDRWAWLPGGDPTSLLFRWAVTRLSGDNGPYPDDLRARVREHLQG